MLAPGRDIFGAVCPDQFSPEGDPFNTWKKELWRLEWRVKNGCLLESQPTTEAEKEGRDRFRCDMLVDMLQDGECPPMERLYFAERLMHVWEQEVNHVKMEKGWALVPSAAPASSIQLIRCGRDFYLSVSRLKIPFTPLSSVQVPGCCNQVAVGASGTGRMGEGMEVRVQSTESR